jgi:thiamine pyrophosphate-dependent acetolactate synthase large subunit-like protein
VGEQSQLVEGDVCRHRRLLVTEGPRHEKPLGSGQSQIRWVSDVLAQVLRGMDIEYVAQVSGSTFSGLHDSIVHHLGNEHPQIITALDELAAVGIAHGYSKATGRMMAAALHGNVGLLRASMAIFNCWSDRAPVLLIGGASPDDETRRRLSDWTHSEIDNGGLIRQYVKWDAAPRSAVGAIEALLRARQIAMTAPGGPVFVSFASDFQDLPVKGAGNLSSFERYRSPGAVAPSAQDVASASAILSQAERPVILLGRCSSDMQAWADRVRLAEALDAPVVTLIRLPACFPTDHPLHISPPFYQWLPEAAKAALSSADAILALDWTDLQNTLGQLDNTGGQARRIINVSCDDYGHGGWGGLHRRLAPADLHINCETDPVVSALLETIAPRERRARDPETLERRRSEDLDLSDIACALQEAAADIEVTLTRLPFRWPAEHFPFRGPLDYIGYDGGSAIGSGPGISVGAALGLMGTGRLAISIMGDGDFLMGCTALWTAVHYGIPLLVIVANNQSFFADEEHQSAIARRRERPAGNQWIGCRITDPAIDLVGMARSLGAIGIGPVRQAGELPQALGEAIAQVQAGKVVVLDAAIR